MIGTAPAMYHQATLASVGVLTGPAALQLHPTRYKPHFGTLLPALLLCVGDGTEVQVWGCNGSPGELICTHSMEELYTPVWPRVDWECTCTESLPPSPC